MSKIRFGIVDANAAASKEYQGIVASIIGQWIEWEGRRFGFEVVPPESADVIFLAFAGSVNWRGECRKALKRIKIEHVARKRGRSPYIIAGGPVDATPFIALEIADALVVGEGYRLVRAIFEIAKQNGTVSDIRHLFETDPNAIERSQTDPIERDPVRPWLLAKQIDPLASPDSYVDWNVPSVKTDDKVVRIIGSKGCHFKCSYCATTYRQAYTGNPNERKVRAQIQRLSKAGHRVQVLSNDPANIPWYADVSQKLDSGSYTIEEFLKAENRAAIIRQRPKIVRFGVEGLSPRIRFAWNKPIPDPTLLDVLNDLQKNKINSHMFLIAGAPYETFADWEHWLGFVAKLTRMIHWGICRIKLTSFQPNPPAPLMRFVSGAGWEAGYRHFMREYFNNHVSPHVLLINPRLSETRKIDVAEQLQIDNATALKLITTPGTIDLAPTVEDFARLASNIVEWPIDARRRWRVAETYKNRMHSNKALPAVATIARSLKPSKARRKRTETSKAVTPFVASPPLLTGEAWSPSDEAAAKAIDRLVDECGVAAAGDRTTVDAISKSARSEVGS